MMKHNPKRIIGTVVMATGILMMAAGLAYQLVNYPWRILLEKAGVEVSTSLPDPPPLSAEYRFYDPDGQPAQQEGGGGDTSVLPSESMGLPLVSAAPPVDLTLIGAIKIPYLGVSANIVEGSDAELQYGVGHVAGTALPGQPGNCVLSGHRAYIPMHPFMHLPKLREGDTVELTMQGQSYTYEIYKIFEVTPEDTWVIHPQEGETAMVTLITCTPIPSFTHRLICWGRLIPAEAQEGSTEEAS